MQERSRAEPFFQRAFRATVKIFVKKGVFATFVRAVAGPAEGAPYQCCSRSRKAEEVLNSEMLKIPGVGCYEMLLTRWVPRFRIESKIWSLNFNSPFLILHGEISADHFFIVADVNSPVGKRRMRPYHITACSGVGRFEQVRAADLLVSFGA